MTAISSIISSSSEEFRQVVFDRQGVSENAQYLGHRPAKLEVVLDDCNEAVCDDGDVNLYPDSILGITPERLDLEMLFDPFEEKFHLPAVAVKQGNVLACEIEVVGVVDERLPKVGSVVDNSSDFSWVIPSISVTNIRIGGRIVILSNSILGFLLIGYFQRQIPSNICPPLFLVYCHHHRWN